MLPRRALLFILHPRVIRRQQVPHHNNSYSTTANPPPPPPRTETRAKKKRVVAILGGGITGLSTAHYLRKHHSATTTPVVIESSSRLGGWVKTVTTASGSRYEIGPRTLRPAGVAGLNTLDLVEELGLDKQVLYVEKDHPTARNRFVYVKGKLCRLPSDGKVLWRKEEPFSYPLVWAVLRDLVKWRKRAPDDSIHAFVERRFGPEPAAYLVDPLIRGICAGSSRDISVKFLMRQMYEYEQQFGSVVKGFLISRILNKDSKPELPEDHKEIGFSRIAASSGNWAVWTLENGLGSLASALETSLEDSNVLIKKGTRVQGVRAGQNGVVELELAYDDGARDSLTCDHVVSTLSAWQLGTLLGNSSVGNNPELVRLLQSVKSVDLQVTCLTYDDPYAIEQNGFGFLVPSSEPGVDGLLGVVFDTNSFPQESNKTVITVMSRDADGGVHGLDKIKWYVGKTLGLKAHPSEHYVEVLRSCIPQYSVGHYEKMGVIKGLVREAFGGRMSVAGASWGGVSVNDCVLGGRDAAMEVGRRFSGGA